MVTVTGWKNCALFVASDWDHSNDYTRKWNVPFAAVMIREPVHTVPLTLPAFMFGRSSRTSASSA
jgi:hypothetical protein